MRHSPDMSLVWLANAPIEGGTDPTLSSRIGGGHVPVNRALQGFGQKGRREVQPEDGSRKVGKVDEDGKMWTRWQWFGDLGVTFVGRKVLTYRLEVE